MNKAIVDSSGKIIPGLIRTANGSIVVENNKEKMEYIRYKTLNDRINKIENSMLIIENSLNNIISLLNNKTNIR